MRPILILSLVAGSAALLPASIIATVEAPGVQSTTMPGVITQDFNGFAPGAFAGGVTNIGTYSTGAEIVSPDAFGGANASNYNSVGTQSGTTSYSLTFAGLQSYFGLYWMAIDGQNELQFYNNGNLVQTFFSNTIQALLVNPDAYLGNPNNGLDPTEHFAYVNFHADASSSFDEVVFSNFNTGTGFETDNHSIAAVPEPGAYVIPVLGLLGLGVFRWTKSARRCSRRSQSNA
jgi:hypothetical protein